VADADVDHGQCKAISGERHDQRDAAYEHWLVTTIRLSRYFSQHQSIFGTSTFSASVLERRFAPPAEGADLLKPGQAVWPRAIPLCAIAEGLVRAMVRRLWVPAWQLVALLL
jgi:hypothetical protein